MSSTNKDTANVSEPGPSTGGIVHCSAQGGQDREVGGGRRKVTEKQNKEDGDVMVKIKPPNDNKDSDDGDVEDGDDKEG